MCAARIAKGMVAPILGAFLFLALFAAGCGTASSGESGGVGEYAGILTDRYDDLFPDDRVQTVRITMAEADFQSMQASMTAKEYYRADIAIDDETIAGVAVRTKGSSSLMGAIAADKFRAGLKVDFNFFNTAQSYHGITKMVYNNGFSDPTLMREFLGYELMAAMGVPTPGACFVDLWVNDVRLGLYTQVEAIDARFLAENFAPGTGNLYKPELKAGALDWTEADAVAQAAGGASSATTTTSGSINLGGGDFEEIIDRFGDDAGWIPGRIETSGAGGTTTSTVGGGARRPGAPPPLAFMAESQNYLVSIGLKTNENAPDYSGLYRMLEVMNADPEEVSMGDLEKVLEVDEILRFLAVSVALVHLDNYIGMGHNYYLYEDGGKFSIIPWDLNMSFGGFKPSLDEDSILHFFVDEPTSAAVAEYPLVEQLISEPEYLETYHGYLQQLIDGPFSVDRMTARIEQVAELIRPYVETDEHMFHTPVEFERGLTADVVPGGAGMTNFLIGKFIGLAYFVETRVASIAAQLSGEQPAGSGDGSGNGGVKGLPIGPGQGGPPGGLPPRPGNAPGGGASPVPAGGAGLPDAAIPDDSGSH